MPKRNEHPNPMDSDEVREALEEIGLSQIAFADMINVDGSAFRRQLKSNSFPGGNIVLLRLLRNHPELIAEAWEHAGIKKPKIHQYRGRPPTKKKVKENA